MEHIRKILFCALFTFIILLFTACEEPSPLYGTWADGLGNTLSLYSDSTFNMKQNKGPSIEDSDYELSDGNYGVQWNVLTFFFSDGRRFPTEWDIRGNIMYITWPKEGSITALTLYKVSS